MRRILVIYKKPTDFPEWPFVMREHEMDNGQVRPTANYHGAKTLKELRDRIPDGYTRMPRSDGDEPQIVEWYCE